MDTPQPEPPAYILPQRVSRAVIPKIVTLLLLGTLLYAGILVNVSLLDLSADNETVVRWSSLGLVLLIIVLGTYFSFRRASQPYLFYHNRLEFNSKEMLYSNIINTIPTRSFLDNIFKTYSINLGQNFHVRNIPEEMPIQSYLQQLQQYRAP